MDQFLNIEATTPQRNPAQAQTSQQLLSPPQAPSPPTDIDMMWNAVMRDAVVERLLPLMSQRQVDQLRGLCEDFDSCYKALVAAHAAQDAVEKVRLHVCVCVCVCLCPRLCVGL